MRTSSKTPNATTAKGNNATRKVTPAPTGRVAMVRKAASSTVAKTAAGLHIRIRRPCHVQCPPWYAVAA